ncbi:MAG: hypothetical protein HUJ72_07000, partial [Blautia sp.]|nr:hypothetical protein [Blautia sp.]
MKQKTVRILTGILLFTMLASGCGQNEATKAQKQSKEEELEGTSENVDFPEEKDKEDKEDKDKPGIDTVKNETGKGAESSGEADALAAGDNGEGTESAGEGTAKEANAL